VPDAERLTCVVDCAAYADGRRVGDLSLEEIRPALEREGQFVWLGLFEPDEALMRRVQQQFALHDLAVEDAYAAHQRPKLEVYDDSLFAVLRTAAMVDDGPTVVFGETHAFVGHNYIVTVRHGSLQSHSGLRHRCESMPHLLAKGPGYVLYALMDFVVDQYLPVVQRLEEEVERLEETILDDVPDAGSVTADVFRLKREAVSLRRAIAPLVDVCNRLMRFELPIIPEDTHVYFRDVYDHVLRLDEAIDAQRELLTTALEAHWSMLSVAQNEQMKRITAWAGMIAVPTMIAGIWGMNFAHMPELQWAYGYHLALGVMTAASAGLYVWFRKSGWL